MTVEEMTDQLARETEQAYVCAACWGPLLRKLRPDGMASIECANDPEHDGYSTKYWVERQRQNDLNDALEAKHLLRQIGVVPNPLADKTEKELIERLGF